MEGTEINCCELKLPARCEYKSRVMENDGEFGFCVAVGSAVGETCPYRYKARAVRETITIPDEGLIVPTPAVGAIKFDTSCPHPGKVYISTTNSYECTACGEKVE